MKKTWNIFSKRYWTKENLFMSKEEFSEINNEFKNDINHIKQDWRKSNEKFQAEQQELKEEWQQTKREAKIEFEKTREELKEVWKEMKVEKKNQNDTIDKNEEEPEPGIFSMIGKWMWALGYKTAKLRYKSLFVWSIPILLAKFYDTLGLLIGVVLSIILLSMMKVK